MKIRVAGNQEVLVPGTKGRAIALHDVAQDAMRIEMRVEQLPLYSGPKALPR
jgi:hypothetical protein